MPSLTGKRILVTGASGFIGSWLCLKLEQEDAEVHGLSRGKPDHDIPYSRWWQCDMADLEKLRHVYNEIRPHFIFHLASHVLGSRQLDVVVSTLQNNLVSTVNLLTLAAQSGCERIILTGSLEEPEWDKVPEVPSSPYAAAKFSASAYARLFRHLYEVPVVTARVFMVYGPRQKDLSKLIPYSTLCLLRGEPPKVTSGTRPVDWVYVEDVVDGFVALSKTPDLEGATIDIGSGAVMTVRAVVELLCEVMESSARPVFGAVADRPMETVRKARAEDTYSRIGWRAKTSPETGLRKTIEWYRKLSETRHDV
jgi:UDP-glucose 4-epimerase